MSETDAFGITENTKQFIRDRLQRLLTDVPAILGAFLATDDGFEICDVIAGTELDPARLAAISSSMVALSHAMVAESALGESSNMIIEAKRGTIVLLSVTSTMSLSLTIIARPGATIGQVLMMSKLAAADIEEKLN